MSGPFGSSQWMYNAGGGFYDYEIDDSLRFNDGDAARLADTMGTPTNTDIATISVWVKRGQLTGVNQAIVGGYDGSSGTASSIYFDTSNRLHVAFGGGGGALKTNALFRDVSAWYHILVAFNSTEGTSSNRCKIYVNGQQITSFSSSSYPSLNQNNHMFSSGSNHRIGSNWNNSGNFFDGYMAEFNGIDGAALTPDSFGETKDGIWVPKEISGLTYGNNGFRLDFANSSAIGNDVSGNNNDWTPVNLAATDVVLDSPTNNFATLNPLDSFNSPTFSEGNLKLVRSSGYGISSGTIAVNSGKWYWEIRCPTVTTSGENESFGISKVTSNVIGNNYLGVNTNSWALMIDNAASDIYFNHNNSFTDSGINASNGDIFMFALDADTGKLWFGRNGTWFDSGNPSAGTNQKYTANTDDVYYVAVSNLGNDAFILNFGQDSSFAGGTTAGGNADGNGKGDFKYSVPSGYLALCTANLPEPEIIDGSEYFNTVLYSGNGGTQDITTVGFQPDWVWNKRRDGAASHVIYDSVRGTGNELGSNYTAAEATGVPGVTAFLSNGYSLGNNGNINDSGETYASWNWLAGTAVSGNTTGSGTAKAYSGSVNTESGFSIITYKGNGTAGHTIPHNLGAKPSMVLFKNRDVGDQWAVYHKDILATHNLCLNNTDAPADQDNRFNDTEPTSSVMTLGTGHVVNANDEDYIAYFFTDIDQYCKAGVYSGNGNADGTYVHLGFRPSFLLIKRSDDASHWAMIDTVRSPYNVSTAWLAANLNSSEAGLSTNSYDILSNGFKARDTLYNVSGGTYIYLALAEQPFKYANAK